MSIKIMKKELNNLIPEEFCLACDVCCRYTEELSSWAPFILKEELSDFKNELDIPVFIRSSGIKITPVKNRDRYICPFFIIKDNRCRIYSRRPFDCRLYPFVINYGSDYSKVSLSYDRQCPFASDKNNIQKLEEYACALRNELEKEETTETIFLNPALIMAPSDNFRELFRLEALNKKIFKGGLGLKATSLKDRDIFTDYFNRTKTKNYAYNFAHIYCWKDSAHITWSVIDANLLVFWSQGDDCFLLLPPLGEKISAKAIEYAKEVCTRTNQKLVIENVTQGYTEKLTEAGFKFKPTNREYIYDRIRMVSLSGDRFKSQRWAYNRLKKNNPVLCKLKAEDAAKCLTLYSSWAEKRLKKYKDSYYENLLEDSFSFQKRALLDFDKLNLTGITVNINDNLAGYSLGYPLDKETFCIMAEVGNLEHAGISEYLSREFSSMLEEFKFINAGDDAGLENLRKVKIAWHPVKTNPVFTTT